MKYQRQINKLKIGTLVPAIIETEGLRIKATVIVSRMTEHGNVEYTIPNMHFYIQNGKLTENIKLEIGEHMEGGIYCGQWAINKPLTELAEGKKQ